MIIKAKAVLAGDALTFFVTASRSRKASPIVGMFQAVQAICPIEEHVFDWSIILKRWVGGTL
jgi:hypothetical protein